MDYFFNQRVEVLKHLDARQMRLLQAGYPGPDWKDVLPALPPGADQHALRAHPRFTLNCPVRIGLPDTSSTEGTIIEISHSGFLARLPWPMRIGMLCEVHAELGQGIRTRVVAEVVRGLHPESGHLFGFRVEHPDEAWQRCVAWMDQAAAPKTIPGREPTPILQCAM